MNTQDEKFASFNKSLNAISFEELQAKNEIEEKKTNNDFEQLKTFLNKGMCYYCGNSLTHFSQKKPCLHWFFWQAKGLRKKYFELLLTEKGYHQTETYLRWVANCEAPFKNINNLAEEKNSTKFIETTIRYKNLEWSFSCSHGDREGHPEKYAGKHPHFHFQMKINENVVIKYNDFHIPFIDYDEFYFAVERGEFDRLKGGHIHGAGMEELLSNLSPEEIIDTMTATDDENNAHYKVDTFIVADEGKTISGDDIAKLIEEKNRTGVPLAKLVEKLEGVSVQTIISPGPGVPEMSKRKKNRGNKHNQS